MEAMRRQPTQPAIARRGAVCPSTLVMAGLCGVVGAAMLAAAPGGAERSSQTASEPSSSGAPAAPAWSPVWDAASALRSWLGEHASPQAIAELARQSWSGAVRDAREHLSMSWGLLTPEFDGSGEVDAWSRLDEQAKLPARVVVLVHGLDETGSIWDSAAPALARAGYRVVRFDYPNDQAITSSADELSQALSQLRSAGVERVDLVTHSMGGLVARDVLTRSEHYAGVTRGHEHLPDAERLIMLGTPNAGAPLAPLRGVMELREHVARWAAGSSTPSSALLGFLVDGSGEAGDDLEPGSAFLRVLNARPAPEGLATTLIVGRLAPWTDADLRHELRGSLLEWIVGPDGAGMLADRVAALADLAGDGAVPGGSAASVGATDCVEVNADHRSMIRTVEALEWARGVVGDRLGTPPAIPIIIERLGRPVAPVAE